MKTFLIFLLFFLFGSFGFSQSLEQQTLSSLGISQPNIEFSVGETIIFGNTALTQGFHQGKLIMTGLNKPDALPGIRVFPNPSISILNVVNHSVSPVDIRFYDTNGNLQIERQHVIGFESLIIQDLPSGNYILVITASHDQLKSFLIQKIN